MSILTAEEEAKFQADYKAIKMKSVPLNKFEDLYRQIWLDGYNGGFSEGMSLGAKQEEDIARHSIEIIKGEQYEKGHADGWWERSDR